MKIPEELLNFAKAPEGLLRHGDAYAREIVLSKEAYYCFIKDLPQMSKEEQAIRVDANLFCGIRLVVSPLFPIKRQDGITVVGVIKMTDGNVDLLEEK